MANEADGIYVTKDKKAQEIHAPIPGEEQVPGDWEMLGKEQSAYFVEYNKHMEMEQMLKNEKKKDRKGRDEEDGAEMKGVKASMTAVTNRLHEEIPENYRDYRAKLLDTVKLYDRLLEKCDDYIDNHHSIFPVGRRRKRMVEDIRKRALEERRQFANLGSSDHLFENRAEGMILGNVLGNYSVMRSVEDYTEHRVEDGFTEEGVFLKREIHKRDEANVETLSKDTYYVSAEKNELHPICKSARAASILMSYLGVGELTKEISLVSVRDKKDERHFGIRVARKYNDSDMTMGELKERYAGQKVNIIYSAEVIRQMSIIQMMAALLGMESFDPEKDLCMIGDKEQDKGELVFRVSHVYLDMLTNPDVFSDTTGNELKKKRGNLPAFDELLMPAMDKEFATALLAMRPEDLGILSGTLLNASERKAFESRLTHMQTILKERLAKEETMPADKRSIWSREDFQKKENRDRLQKRMRARNSRLMPGLFDRERTLEIKGTDDVAQGTMQVTTRLEGTSDVEGEYSAYYEKVYMTIREKLSGMHDVRERYSYLADLYGCVQLNQEEKAQDAIKREASDSAIKRLIEEFMDDDMLAERCRQKAEVCEKIRQAYDTLSSEIKTVPPEYRKVAAIENEISEKVAIADIAAKEKGEDFDREAAEQKAAEDIEKQVLSQYIALKIQETMPQLALEYFRFESFMQTQMISGINRTMKTGYAAIQNTLTRVGSKFAKSYDSEHGKDAFDDVVVNGSRIGDHFKVFKFLNPEKTEPVNETLYGMQHAIWQSSGV